MSRKSKKPLSNFQDSSNDVRTRTGIHTIPPEKLKQGSLKGLIKTALSDGRTTIYIRVDHNVKEVAGRYERYLNRFSGDGTRKIKRRAGAKLDTARFNEI
jgi:hypothetical protein